MKNRVCTYALYISPLSSYSLKLCLLALSRLPTCVCQTKPRALFMCRMEDIKKGITNAEKGRFGHKTRKSFDSTVHIFFPVKNCQIFLKSNSQNIYRTKFLHFTPHCTRAASTTWSIPWLYDLHHRQKLPILDSHWIFRCSDVLSHVFLLFLKKPVA